MTPFLSLSMVSNMDAILAFAWNKERLAPAEMPPPTGFWLF